MTFKDTLNFRHACKIFDENKKISQSDFDEILQAARLSPSSLGLEHWEIWLINNRNLRQKLKEICLNQAQITTASHLLVIFAKIADLKIGSKYIENMISRRMDKNSSQHSAYLSKTNQLLTNFGQSELEIFAWSKAQCFLAAQNMMSMAASLGIDSCPIEGWSDENALNLALKNDKSQKRIALILTFGYRINEPKPKIRRNLDEFVKIID